MKRKLISVILVLAMMMSLTVPCAAASNNADYDDPIYTQSVDFEGKTYTLDVFIDGSSNLYTNGEVEQSVLHFAPDGVATASITTGNQEESFILDIEDLSSESVDFDVYEADDDGVQPLSNEKVSSDDPIMSISSLEQLEAIVTGPQTRAAVTVTVISLLALVLVAVTLVSASRYIDGIKHDYVSVIIDAVREMDDNSPKYFRAYLLSGDKDVLINFLNPISRNVAAGSLCLRKDVYTFFYADALAVVQAATEGNSYQFTNKPEINANRLEGHIYYYHFHVTNAQGNHLAHAWFGFPYTK